MKQFVSYYCSTFLLKRLNFVPKSLCSNCININPATTELINSSFVRFKHNESRKEENFVVPKIHSSSQFVPDFEAARPVDVERLRDFVQLSKNLMVLTGAGLSTESGIPDYRSVGVGLYARTSHRPLQYQQFLKDAKARQRYWARNFIGWPRFSSLDPNPGHLTLSQWERGGVVKHIVTQNVDELHRKEGRRSQLTSGLRVILDSRPDVLRHSAGSVDTIELHGSTHRIICLSCDSTLTRHDLQNLFIAANQHWTQCSDVARGIPQMAPDGDVLLTDEEVKNFIVPACPSCGTGVLKPDLIFFGDNVPLPLVDRVYNIVDQSDALLVVGSSLFVYSGYRFVLRAHQRGARIAILNIGPTRADHLTNLKIEGRCGEVLPLVQL